MKKFTFKSILFLALSLVSFTSFAQTTIEFSSLNRKQGLPAVLAKRAQYTDAITGVLTYPQGTVGNVPVMVIMHSSGGINNSIGEWSDTFLKIGIATFVVDSFGPRGISTTTEDQAQITSGASVIDALMALKIVATQPKVDPKRIGVIGFSRGGLAAATSSFEAVRAAVLGADNPLKFALHVPFYGGCTQVGTPTSSPILLFAAAHDDFVSIKSCNSAVTQMKAKGANIEYVVYSSVFHGFDVDREKLLYTPNGQSWRECVIRQDLDDGAYYAGDAKVDLKGYNAYFGQCMTRGVSVGYDWPAKYDAQTKTKAFVSRVFGLQAPLVKE